jgi:hypothetical protein
MFLRDLLGLLSANKRYPKYQHERRIDIFLQFFLPKIIESQCGTPVTLVMPEFPLKKPNSSLATNIDYLAFSKLANVAYICELKTDPLSFRHEQVERYFQALNDGWAKILADVRQIRQDTSKDYQSKYDFLLEKADTISVDVKLKILYLAPEKTRVHLDQFSKSADFLFLPLEDLKTIQITTSYAEEWSLVRESF